VSSVAAFPVRTTPFQQDPLAGYAQQVKQQFVQGAAPPPEVSTSPFGSSPLADYRAEVAARFLHGPPMFRFGEAASGRLHGVA
jgi:hypothetical protein